MEPTSSDTLENCSESPPASFNSLPVEIRVKIWKLSLWPQVPKHFFFDDDYNATQLGCVRAQDRMAGVLLFVKFEANELVKQTYMWCSHIRSPWTFMMLNVNHDTLVSETPLNEFHLRMSNFPGVMTQTTKWAIAAAYEPILSNRSC